MRSTASAVNAVCPGDIDTPMTDMAGSSSTSPPKRSAKSSSPTYPLGKVGQPIDIAHAVMYLASDAAGFVTGTLLSIDGGTTAR